MTKNSHSNQQIFLRRLARRFNTRAELVADLVRVLHLGKDAIYRRLRGDTVLTADELILLAQTYRISIETREDVPSLTYPLEQSSVSSEVEYVQRLWNRSREMINTPDISVDYASPELPVYYEFCLPTLRSFKLFMYGITTWQLPKFEGQAFSPRLIDPAVHDYAEQLVEIAYRLPGRELWSIGVLDVTLRQIAYIHQVGRFADTTVIDLLFTELHTLVDHLEKMARSGRRFQAGRQPDANSPEFMVYHNELSSTNSAVIIKGKNHSYLFSTLVAPSYTVTADPQIVQDVQQWFDQLVGISTRLSMDFAKYTSHYFDRLRQQITSYEQRVRTDTFLF